MKTIIDTKTVSNFLSEDEIKTVEAIAAQNTHWSHPDTSYEKSSVPLANYHYFDLYKDGPHKPLADLLLPRIKALFHPEIFIDDCHIMDSVQPYTPHTDVLTPVPRPGYMDHYHSARRLF